MITDNCVSPEEEILQILADIHRCNYVTGQGTGTLVYEHFASSFQGPRVLTDYDGQGKVKESKTEKKVWVHRSFPVTGVPLHASLPQALT